MPTYDYECESCGHRFEVFQRMTDPKLEACPRDDCGGRVRRLLGTGAGLIFKGSGFYQTDYRSEAYRKAQNSESKPAESKDGAAAKESAPESKPSGTKSCGAGCGCAAA